MKDWFDFMWKYKKGDRISAGEEFVRTRTSGNIIVEKGTVGVVLNTYPHAGYEIEWDTLIPTTGYKLIGCWSKKSIEKCTSFLFDAIEKDIRSVPELKYKDV